MKEARIVDGEICYPTKYADTVFNLFQARYKLHKNYYNNVFSVAFEQMIQEVFSLVKVIMSKTFCDPKFDLKKGDNLEKKTSLRLSNFL
jgi:HD superfamily phosphohydrolase